jgi:hypothetical protein
MAKRNFDAALRRTDFNRDAAAVTGTVHIEKLKRLLRDSDCQSRRRRQLLLRMFPATASLSMLSY